MSMKGGEGSNICTTFPNLPKPTSAFLPQDATINNMINSNNNAENLQPNGVVIREQDHYLPIANVIRIMRRTLPFHVKISDEAKETIQECTSEFISFITGEANEHCQKEQRKTINADDLIWAMTKLGFDDYVGPLSFYLARYRELERSRGRPLHGPQPIVRGSIGPEPIVGLPFGNGPEIDMGLMMPGMFDVGPTLDGLHFIDMSGASSSSFHLPFSDYDPLGQFK